MVPTAIWVSDLVESIVKELVNAGLPARLVDRDASGLLGEDDVALLIVVDCTRIDSPKGFLDLSRPWRTSGRWAILEARPEAVWGAEVGAVLPEEPHSLTRRGLTQALRQLTRGRGPAPKVREGGGRVSALGSTLPFAAAAALLEPLDFEELRRLLDHLRLKDKKGALDASAIPRFLALPGTLTADPRGVAVDKPNRPIEAG